MSLINIVDPLEDKSKTQAEFEERYALGIDLGTSNSVVAIYKDDEQIEVIEDKFSRLIPSILCKVDGKYYVGNHAKVYQGQTTILQSMKRFMGKNYLPESSMYHTMIDQQDKQLKFLLEDEWVSAIDVSANILTYLKKLATKHLKIDIKDAVITVPAYFDEQQRQSTRLAAQRAGLNVLRLINEPTAAALAYGLETAIEGVYIVYDLGGGTFDVSVLSLEKGVFKVLSTAGDTELGGDDIDQLLLALLVNKLTHEGIDIVAEQYSYLLSKAKELKEYLSYVEQYNISLKFHEQHVELNVSRLEFNAIIDNLVIKTLKICDFALSSLTKHQMDSLQGVILVGGSTKIPYIQHKIANFFNKDLFCELNPDEVVAIGAAYKAADLVGKGKNSLLLDVIPLSLGIELAGGIVEKIIPRNTLIPIAKRQEFTTFKDNQTAISIHVLQGERELVADLRSLGRFAFKGIPPRSAGVAKIEVTFTVDADGLLTVTAMSKDTNQQQQLEIKPSFDLDYEQMKKMVLDSMEHAEDDIKQRLLIQEKIEAQRVIDALIKALHEDGDLLLENEKIIIDQALNELLATMQSNDQQLINKKVQNLETVTNNFAANRVNRNLNKVLKNKSLDEI